MNMKFVCPCLMGLESLVSQELKDMGASDVKADNGRVFFSGDLDMVARSNIQVRFGERILIVLSKFTATSFEELFENVKKIDWENYIGIKDRFPVKGKSLKSKLASVPDCQSIIKKAIVEKLKLKYKVNWFEETQNTYQIQFFILKDEVCIMLDTTGEPLYKRGYKKNRTVAPIRETLAAAMVKLAHVRCNSLLVDPFCGSGTILTEGCLYELNIAPGLRRNFAFEKWDFVPKECIVRERELALSNIRRDSEFQAVGYDCDPKALEIAKENANSARVLSKIRFERQDIRNFKLDSNYERISVVCNPPYGERMLDKQNAYELYKIMGEKFVKRDGVHYYIISSDDDFERYFGRVADKRRKLYNGMIKCYYHMYFKKHI